MRLAVYVIIRMLFCCDFHIDILRPSIPAEQISRLAISLPHFSHVRMTKYYYVYQTSDGAGTADLGTC
jgi:hypothetical protein